MSHWIERNQPSTRYVNKINIYMHENLLSDIYAGETLHVPIYFEKSVLYLSYTLARLVTE